MQAENPGSEPFEERVALLFEELELAIRWQRPSILVAVYESEFVRRDAQAILAERMAGLGQKVYRFRVDAKNFDVPLALSQFPGREKTVFFVTGLRWGGGRGGYDAYRALNLRREHFVEHPIRAVFWLTRSEANHLPRRAPDFWAFRHRVIEFFDQPAHVESLPSAQILTWGGWKLADLLDDVDGKIALREAQLVELPDRPDAGAARLDLLEPLASLYWAKGEGRRAIDLLLQALAIAQALHDPARQSRLWVGLGSAYQNLDQDADALAAFKKAIQLDPQDASPWSNLAVFHRDRGRYDEALQACHQALDRRPADAGSWNTLGNVYRDLGRFEAAREAYLKAARSAPDQAAPWINLGGLYCGLDRTREAVRAYHKAARLDPHRAEPWKSLAAVYQGLGRIREAAKAYRTALALDPQDASVQTSLEACYQQLKKS